MAASLLPPPKEVLSIVEEELTNVGGRIASCERQKGRLFLRATVPHTQQVRPNDHIQGGVAVSTLATDVCVYPLVFRQMCKSGAIMSEFPGFKRIKRVESGASAQTMNRLRQRIREQVQSSTSAETLQEITRRLRAAAAREVDAATQMSSLISRIPRSHSSLLLSQILSEFHEDEDASVYALMNAVSAVARDEDDPTLKWNLEILAGGVTDMASDLDDPAFNKAEFAAVG